MILKSDLSEWSYKTGTTVYGLFIASYRVFLANQFEQLQPHFETMIPSNKKAFLQQFYTQVIIIPQQ